MTLDTVEIGKRVRILRVGGERSFRRRLLELGLLPGCELVVQRVAPLGDPIELTARGAHLSIRRKEATCIDVALTEEKN